MREEVVAPAMGVVVIPLVPVYHWYDAAPLATTDNVVDAPAMIVVEAGCVVIARAGVVFAATA
jgi:hypothetical protein